MLFDKSKFEKSEVNDIVNLSYGDEDAFKNGTDIPFKVLKEADTYRAQYLEEATELAAKEAKSIMEKNSKINKVVVSFPYSTSKRGSYDVTVDRSKTYGGMNGADPVTKSKITGVVTDPINKVSKSRVREIEAELTKVLIK